MEPIIAFSICYVAVENIYKKEVSHRWMVTFLFGLIHGMGLAGILHEMSLPKTNLAVSLLSFNLGIELIQLRIVLVLLPLLNRLHQWSSSGRFIAYASYAITVVGGIWLVERLWG